MPIILLGDWLMKVRSAVSFMALGAGSVLAYQQVKNGNFDKMMKKFKKEKKRVIKEMEDMD